MEGFVTVQVILKPGICLPALRLVPVGNMFESAVIDMLAASKLSPETITDFLSADVDFQISSSKESGLGTL